jgi:hypothetical protein
MRDALTHAGDVAGVLADDGHRRRALSSFGMAEGSAVLRLACREACQPLIDEQRLIDRVEQTCAAAGLAFPRWLIVNFYISLKINPLVILAGAEGTGKADFTKLFAAALLGPDSPQFALIPGRVAWHAATGEGSYYRSLHDRFSSLRFLELLQEAAAPANAGKLYLVCFQRVNPDEIELYLSHMIRLGADGQRYLALTGTPPAQQPVIPPNVRISATIDTPDDPSALSQAALSHAGVIDFLTSPAQRLAGGMDQIAPAPPGLQRLWLRAAICETAVARRRLNQVLGPDYVLHMKASLPIQRALWSAGLTIYGHMLQELTVAVANSFDQQGSGLFDPADPQRNAQIAYDTQLIQRIRWQVRGGGCPSIAEYFGAIQPPTQRVA